MATENPNKCLLVARELQSITMLLIMHLEQTSTKYPNRKMYNTLCFQHRLSKLIKYQTAPSYTPRLFKAISIFIPRRYIILYYIYILYYALPYRYRLSMKALDTIVTFNG